MGRIPYKLTVARYHSLVNYFRVLKKLGWLEETVEQDKLEPQDYFDGFQPRVYYRLTRKGIEASDPEWSRPQFVLYPEVQGKSLLAYTREKRSEHHYSKKSPTK